MKNDPKITELIGIAIHIDWLKRNQEHPNQDLKVPYSNLDEWTQQQDLTVFSALLSVAEQNKEKYTIKPVEGKQIPDYLKEESDLLGMV